MYVNLYRELTFWSFNIRALFERMVNSKGELNFKKGDILYVTDTMFNGHMGCWRACLVNEEDAQKREIGMVPSRMKYVEQWTTKMDYFLLVSPQ